MPKPLHERHPWVSTPVRRDVQAKIYHSVDANSFKKGMRQLPAGVSIVTTGDGGEGRAGFTATAVCSVSAEPPQLLVCVNATSNTHPKIREWKNFCVNVLSSTQHPVACHFASASATADRFEVGDWSVLDTGAPVLKGCPVNFDCTLAREIEAGTHTIFIGNVAAVAVIAGLEPLAFVDGQYLNIGPTKRGSDAELWDWS
ncbi:MAG: flavin reductase [Betaproteobacteria bacterium]|nr:flavin reductase [Betaproteobacteria bacterium]